MAGLTGLEPAASRVTGERYNHLTTTPLRILLKNSIKVLKRKFSIYRTNG